MKIVIRRIYGRVALDQLNVQMSNRNSIIKLVSLVYSQMATSLFLQLVQYSWYTSAYVEAHPDNCSSVIEACFSFEFSLCEEESSSTTDFIYCSWCRNVLCFSSFSTRNYQYH